MESNNSPVCPLCGSELEEQEVLVSRTTSPEDDDVFEKATTCSNKKCGHIEPITNFDEE